MRKWDYEKAKKKIEHIDKCPDCDHWLRNHLVSGQLLKAFMGHCSCVCHQAYMLGYSEAIEELRLGHVQ